ncbi:hypothetical protein HK105_200231 [Polyrhizophydium stewartii]|uniref:Uncharacterized protein n=1 Tax=Polyrhizophydium stewartii TaxID=2732419 RepID=A0ABR4NKW5_9FUNG
MLLAADPSPPTQAASRTGTAQRRPPPLPDDLWLLVLEHVAVVAPESLPSLATSNSVWFHAYRSAYAALSRGVRMAGYPRAGGRPPIDWRSKTLRSLQLERAWAWLGREACAAQAATDDPIAAEAAADSPEHHRTRARLQAMPSPARELVTAPQPWTDVVSHAAMRSFLTVHLDIEDFSFGFTSIVPDRTLALSTSGPASASRAPQPSACLGVSTINLDHNSDEISTTVVICPDITIADPLSAVDPAHAITWRHAPGDVMRSLQLVDLARDMLVAMDESFPDRVWRRLHVFRISDGAAVCSVHLPTLLDPHSPAAPTTATGLAATDEQGGGELDDVFGEADPASGFSQFRWARVAPVPTHLLDALGMSPRDLMLLGWHASGCAVRLLVDVERGRLGSIVPFGEDVCSISEADPYEPNLVVTGHDDSSIRLWRLDTCEPLRVLRGHSAPVWGFAFVDDADDHAPVTGAWQPPASLTLLSVADRIDGSSASQVIMWCIDDVADELRRSAPGAASRIVAESDASRDMFPSAAAASHRDTSGITAQLNLPFDPEDLFSTFYVLHPLLYTVSLRATFSVFHLATGERLHSIPNVAASSGRVGGDFDEMGLDDGEFEGLSAASLAFFSIHRAPAANGAAAAHLLLFLRGGVVRVWDPLSVDRAVVGRVGEPA